MRIYPKVLLLLSLLATPVAAAETPWQTVAPGVTMRLVSAGTIKPDGTTWLGVELDMPQNTKTYWRIPGETGLPTELDFAGSQGITGDAISWPYPERDQSGRYLDYVYHGPTLLPVQLTLDAATAQIEVAVVMGVCSDICVPAQAKFSLPVDGTKDMPNGLRIRQAVAMAPIAWPDAVQPIGDVQYRAADQMLLVHVTDPAVDPDSLIVSTADGEPFFGAPQKSPEPDLVLVPVLGKTHEINLENRPVQLTFTTDMGAYEITRPVQTAE
ncbi:MAG: Thiol-disulfide interchange protein contains DsbC and DsbD domain [Devosia sp.]|uniref:protein-disulfide reductase DsbD domain-containing protein n=1 Tax=Devosia sp. TaxID=1871048 RepID=UPI002638FC61|nr:protein-disulfide reductase DsbD domain-containing protein [Devosia sp.]MDB5588075.1 Thiol-disulfide interchange protein contains DsbC and DsbD domain [Devosia sp.]